MLTAADAEIETSNTTTNDVTLGTSVVLMTNMAQGIVTNTDNAPDVEAALQQQQQQQREDKAIHAYTSNTQQQSTTAAQSSSNNNTAKEESTGPGLTKRRSLKERFLNSNTGTSGSNNANHSNGSNGSQLFIPPHTKTPKDTLQAVYSAGKYKASLRLDVLMVQSTMAGVFIAFAGQLYLSVGGGVLGAVLFPGGLIAVILTSAELFTGDALIFVASVLGGQVPFSKLIRNWSVSWICNFAGSLLWAYFLGYLSHAVEDTRAKELAILVAEKKALDSMGNIFLKGVGANFLVCVAVWQGTCAEEVAGKVLALWWPTASFILLGFSHCIANMYLIPMGMLLGANITVGQMFASLLMATLGNIVGGGIFVGGAYWYVFDSMASFGGLTARIQHNMRSNAATRALQHAGTSFHIPGHHHHHHHHGDTPTSAGNSRHPQTTTPEDSAA